jgi:fructoselysine-6-P-deglycase FrlB-like protein
MATLDDTFAWAKAADVRPLRQAVRTAGLSPLVAIGSGGSFSAALAMASMHQRSTGRLATVATPLETITGSLEPAIATWLLSAGGGNVDVLSAARAMSAREPRQIAVLCGRDDSPLAELCRRHEYVDLLVYSPPTGKDGFLATNSLLGFATLLTRAYAAEFEDDASWTHIVEQINPLLTADSDAVMAWQRATQPLWTRPTTLVLHGPSTRIGAIDLESKFTEAALGNLQLADYRRRDHRGAGLRLRR